MELVSSGNFLRLFPTPAFPCPDHSAEPGLHGLHPRGANRKKCLELGLVRKTQHMCVYVGALLLQSPQLLSMPQVVPLLSPCLTPILRFTHSICPGGAKEAASLAPASHTSPGLRTEAKGEVERKHKQVQWSRSISYGLGAVTAPPISKRPLQMPSRPGLLPSSSRAAYLPSSRS